MSEIIPAVLPRSFGELASALAALRGISPFVQIDVVDGSFAPGMTWPYTDRSAFEQTLAEESGLPYWEDFSFEVDLMVHAARQAAKEWVKAGASRIIVHAESRDSKDALLSLREFREKGAPFAVETGVALSLETPLSALTEFAGLFDSVQLMGIARIGAQGEPLDGRIYARIQELRNVFQGTISVDGGVKLDNARALARAGATRLVAGSAILKAEHVKEAYDALVRETY